MSGAPPPDVPFEIGATPAGIVWVAIGSSKIDATAYRVFDVL